MGAKRKGGEKVEFLRYCPECFAEDLKLYGEPYWHRSHQLLDVRVCTKHGRYLQNTSVPLHDNNWPLRPALLDMPLEDIHKGAPSNQEIDLTGYLLESLYRDHILDEEATFEKVLQEQMVRSKLRSLSGKQNHISALSAKMRAFYEGFVSEEDLGVYALSPTISSNNTHAIPRQVLLVAYYFGLTLDDLFREPEGIDLGARIKERRQRARQ